MDDGLHEDDSGNISEDSGIRPIIGMESVVATVSGYHGTERFKAIKIIACTGANYVGAMDRSITHLVCWKFEGKKYNLARKLKTHIISHCWFEDCLKEGRRLPEGPYTMKSGQEVGPISWEVPAIPEGNAKKRSLFFGERNVEANHYKASHSAKGKEIDLVCLNWSDSHLLKENSFHCWDAEKRLSNSQGCRKSKRVLKKGYQSNKHQISIIDDPGGWADSCPRSSTRLRPKRNFHDDANGEIYAEPTDESNRAIKITEPMDLDILRNQSASPSLDMAPEGIFYENEESRRIGHGEDMEEPNVCSNLVNSDSFERCHVLTVEGDSKIINSLEKRGGADICESGDYRDERRVCDAPSAPSSLDHQKELSCVICWTEFCSLRGALPCGHRFCYSCIQEWADCMASRGKVSTCPLCKENFTKITKIEELASSSEQKIFSQTIPCSSSKLDIFCLPNTRYDTFRASSSGSVCFECQNCEPEDLLLNCHICQTQWVHSCCLDPPLIPWTCIHCRDLRMLYQHFR